MSRKIECIQCGLPLGEIRDAKLRKGIAYLCDSCNTKRVAANAHMRTTDSRTTAKNIVDNLLGGLGR